MSKDLTKKAVDMLLKGATLLSEPCPYCKGVRVLKDGNALCVSCGREPEIEKQPRVPSEAVKHHSQKLSSTLKILEQKLEDLAKEFQEEKDPEKQQNILKSINSLIDIVAKLKK